MTDDLSYDDVEAALFVILLASLGGVREADGGMRLVLHTVRWWGAA